MSNEKNLNLSILRKWRYEQLKELHRTTGRAVTAGEYARSIGVARSTGMRHLSDLCNAGLVSWRTDIHTNQAEMKVYYPLTLHPVHTSARGN